MECNSKYFARGQRQGVTAFPDVRSQAGLHRTGQRARPRLLNQPGGSVEEETLSGAPGVRTGGPDWGLRLLLPPSGSVGGAMWVHVTRINKSTWLGNESWAK